jgi:predicted nucleotidyltransferase
MKLRDLLISKVRVKLLHTFLAKPGVMLHVRELVRRTSEEINAVRRELAHMEKCGMVRKEKRGNRLYYWFRDDYLFYDNLVKLVAKTTGLGKEIVKGRNRLGKLTLVMLSGRFVAGKERKDKAVDLLVVGDQVVMPELAAIVRKEEARREQEINYTVMSEEEFRFRKGRQDPFLISILTGSRVVIWGDEGQLLD